MTGIEFLEQLRTKRPNVPVILMTGYPSVPNAISAIRLGAAGYVTKPFTPEEIASAVHKHVRGGAVERTDERSRPDDSWTPGAAGHLFLRDVSVQYGQDGTARTGLGRRPRFRKRGDAPGQGAAGLSRSAAVYPSSCSSGDKRESIAEFCAPSPVCFKGCRLGSRARAHLIAAL